MSIKQSMFTKLLKYATKNILRNKFLSFSSILVLTLLMFFINLLLVVHSTSFELINYVNDKMSISLYLDSKYDKNSKDVIDLKASLKKASPNSKILYKSKEEVLEEIRQEDIKLVRILEKENPLPNTITISNIPLSDYNDLNYIIEGKLYLFSGNKKENLDNNEEVFSSYKAQYSRITSVITILKTLWVWLYIIIVIFVFAIWIITYSIIWNFIYYYRDEIYITKLVWWSKAFIYWPFSIQWILYSIIAFFISISIFSIFIKYWAWIVFNTSYSLDFVFKNAAIIFPLELLLFIIIWWISWYFSSKKYLK